MLSGSSWRTWLAPPDPCRAKDARRVQALRSERLGLLLRGEGKWLWFFDPETGERVQLPEEELASTMAALHDAEQEAAQLREELARLKNARRDP